jgi:hypothetical protein
VLVLDKTGKLTKLMFGPYPIRKLNRAYIKLFSESLRRINPNLYPVLTKVNLMKNKANVAQ